MTDGLVDWNAFLEMHGDMALFWLASSTLTTVVQSFMATAGKGASCEPDVLAQELHRLRGACAAMCLPTVVSRIREVEAALAQADPAGVETQLERLHTELHRLLSFLDRHDPHP